MKPIIKVFYNGIGFRFWHKYNKECGTGIRWRRLKPGLIGIRVPVYSAIQLGLWWAIEFETIALPPSRFEKHESH